MSRKSYASSAIIPLIALFVALWVSSLRGSFHVGINSDPDYPYLMNAVNLLGLTSPGLIEHPGTTQQLLLALILALRHFFTCAFGGCATLQADILGHTEAYLRFANFMILSGICAALFFLGVYVRSRSASPFPAYLLQGMIFTFPVVLQSMGRVSPEPLLMILSIVYVTPFLVLYLQRRQGTEVAEEEVLRLAIWSGVAFGAGLITKLTFAPLGIMLFALPGAKARLRFALSAAAAAIFFVLPVIHKSPAIFKWAKSLLVHSAQYGGGAPGLPTLSALQASALQLLKQEPFFAVWLVLALAVGFAAKSARKELLLSACGALALLLVTIKHPGARYLIPGMGLLSLAAVIVISTIQRSKAAVSLFVLMACSICCFVIGETNRWVLGQVFYASGAAKLESVAKAAGADCRIYHYYQSNDQISSLIFGNEWASRAHSDVLKSIYPDALRYNAFTGKFDGFDGQDLTDAVIARIEAGQCILLQGTTFIEQNWPTHRGLRRSILAVEAGLTLSALSFDTKAKTSYAEPPREQSLVFEAEKTKAGNAVADNSIFGAGFGALTTPVVPAWAEIEVALPAAGLYEIRARYASESPRPLRLLIGGKTLIPDFCKYPTGGFYGADQKWISSGTFPLPAGTFTVRLESDGPFPVIDKIAFIAAAAKTK